MYNKHPKLVPDIFIDKKEPHLPYTKSSINTKLNIHPHMGSTVNLAVEPEDFLPMVGGSGHLKHSTAKKLTEILIT